MLGPRHAQKHLVDEVQKVYRQQGVSIHDKHIEIIVRQMLRRITILEAGDTGLLPGMLAERARFEIENRRVVSEGGRPASGRPELMGITKASLATDSLALRRLLPGRRPASSPRPRWRVARTRCWV
uniref:Uncharacterized protein n=1 Tax=Janibacter limosus TaxID=53458 RepID=A0AC61U894_9MICO|nr:hypothetical protein [Janibacter limosus]